jgi:hypothetical protein
MIFILTDLSAKKYKIDINKNIEKVCGRSFRQKIILRLKSVSLHLLMDLSFICMLSQREGKQLSLGSLTWTHNHHWIILK